jgi:predicted transcriptional regulator
LEQEMHLTSIASQPTSLKLPAALKKQLADDAQRAGLSLHAFMVQTLADSVRRTRLRDAFTRDSMAALSDMKTSGSGYELENVRAYFSDLASHRKGLQAKPQDLAPTRMG